MNFKGIYRQQDKSNLDQYGFEKDHDANSYLFLKIARSAYRLWKNTALNMGFIGANQLSEDELVQLIVDHLCISSFWYDGHLIRKMGLHQKNSDYYACTEAMARYVMYKHENQILR